MDENWIKKGLTSLSRAYPHWPNIYELIFRWHATQPTFVLLVFPPNIEGSIISDRTITVTSVDFWDFFLNLSLILYFCSCFWTSESSLLRRLFRPMHLCVSLLLLLNRMVFTSSFFICAFSLELESKTWRTFKAINMNIYKNIMMFFKGYIKIHEMAVPLRN